MLCLHTQITIHACAREHTRNFVKLVYYVLDPVLVHPVLILEFVSLSIRPDRMLSDTNVSMPSRAYCPH